jgi:hypothetical protein
VQACRVRGLMVPLFDDAFLSIWPPPADTSPSSSSLLELPVAARSLLSCLVMDCTVSCILKNAAFSSSLRLAASSETGVGS